MTGLLRYTLILCLKIELSYFCYDVRFLCISLSPVTKMFVTSGRFPKGQITLKFQPMKLILSLWRSLSYISCRANQWTGFYMIGTSVMKGSTFRMDTY